MFGKVLGKNSISGKKKFFVIFLWKTMVQNLQDWLEPREQCKNQFPNCICGINKSHLKYLQSICSLKVPLRNFDSPNTHSFILRLPSLSSSKTLNTKKGKCKLSEKILLEHNIKLYWYFFWGSLAAWNSKFLNLIAL